VTSDGWREMETILYSGKMEESSIKEFVRRNIWWG